MGIQRRRRANLLQQPTLQLRLPLILLTVTLGFAAFQMWHAYYAFNEIFYNVYLEAGEPEFLADLIHDQTRVFIEVSAEVAIVYLLLVPGISVLFANRMIGPVTAFRRHIEALKNGDYHSRIQLRKGDAFSEMQDDLNELAQLLERADTKPDPSDPRTR